MPIKGMTNQQAAFPEIGQLRKGAPKPERGIGKDLRHFRFTSEIQEVEVEFHTHYNDEPRLINVFLPFRTADENWEAWQESYVAGGLVHRCDGETMTLWRQQDGSYSTEPKPCPFANGAKPTKAHPECKPVGRLKVIIPELRRLAYVTVLTGSIHDIRNLDAQLRALEALRQDLRGIPLQLRRSPKQISTPTPGGKRARREKWLLSIEAAPTWVHLQLAAQEAEAMPQPPAGATVIDGATGEIVPRPTAGANGLDWDVVPEQPEPEPEPSKAEEPEPKSKAMPRKQKPETNGNGHSRPLDAETIRDTIRKKAGWVDGKRFVEGEPITEGQIGGVNGLLTDTVRSMPPDARDKARHDVLNYLLGITTAKALTKREASAIISWLKVDTDGDWEINEYAKAEVSRILEAVAISEGQLSMELDA